MVNISTPRKKGNQNVKVSEYRQYLIPSKRHDNNIIIGNASCRLFNLTIFKTNTVHCKLQ